MFARANFSKPEARAGKCFVARFNKAWSVEQLRLFRADNHHEVTRREFTDFAFVAPHPRAHEAVFKRLNYCGNVGHYELCRAATPGNFLPSIHSRNAPPAVEI